MTPRSLRLTSAPVLAGALVILTILAAGPLRPIDAALQGFWAKKYTPNWWGFLDSVPNAIAGQAVCLPVLICVAIVLARRHRTWHPLMIVLAAEVAFYAGIGGLKLLLGRTAPVAGTGHFWEGGLFAHGWYGIAYPSGHAAEAILFYGAAAYLLRSYAGPHVRIRTRLNLLVGLITAQSVIVSFYLGYHWPTDLLGGMLAGGLMLRIIVDLDRHIAAGKPILGWQPPTVRTAAAAGAALTPEPSSVLTRTTCDLAGTSLRAATSAQPPASDLTACVRETVPSQRIHDLSAAVRTVTSGHHEALGPSPWSSTLCAPGEEECPDSTHAGRVAVRTARWP